MEWETIGKDEVQDQLNNYDQSNTSEIENILHCWRHNGGNLKFKITGLCTIGDEAIEVEDVRIGHPKTMAMYIMQISIDVKTFL